MQQPPALPVDMLSSESAASSLTLRLTADGFVYLPTTSEEQHTPRSARDVEATTPGGLQEPRFVQIDWAHLSTLWGDLIAQHPILSDPAGEVRVLYPASHYVVIPSGMSGDQDVQWWRLTAPIFAETSQYYCDSYSLGDGKPVLAVGYDNLIKGFIQRSFVASRFVPTILPFTQYVLRHSALQAGFSLGVELFESGCDIVLCQSGDLLRANHYSWPRYHTWQHHLYQVLYFLSKIYLDCTTDYAKPISIILSDGTAGADSLAEELLSALHRQFATADWSVSITPPHYWQS